MISDAVIVAIITGVVTSFGNFLAFATSEKNRKDKIAESHTQQLNVFESRLNSRIEDMEDGFLKELGTVKTSLDNKLDAHKRDYEHQIKGICQQIDKLDERVDGMDKIRADLKADFEKTEAIIKLQIEGLDKKVEKHNSVVERTFKLEQDTAVQTEQIKVINHRLTDLEKGQ